MPALEPAPRPVADVDRLWIVDATLIPVRDRTVGASSRNHRLSANVQVIIDAGSRLVIASARPAPGNKADAHVWRESGLPAVAAGTTVIAEGACLGTGLIVPHRRRAGRPLLRGQEEDNAEHRRVRARVEHTFARMENGKILRDCRQKGDGLHHAVQAIAAMHNRHDTAKQQVRRHFDLPKPDLLQHPSEGVSRARQRGTAGSLA